jgi:chromosome partitioning protein
MGKIIAITNQKGGIGKTTTATSMAGILNERGYKTLLVDADLQCNSSDTFRAQIQGAPTLYDVLLEESNPISVNDAIQHTEIGDIVAADELLEEADSKLTVKGIKGYTKLKTALEDLKGYDYVIIDTPPSVAAVLRNVLIAADEVVIPMKAGRYSFQGLSKLADSINDAKTLNPNLKIAGVLLVDMNERANVSKNAKEALDIVSQTLGTKVFRSVVRSCVKVVEAQDQRLTLIKYAKSCSAERDYEDFVEEYLGI